MRSNLAHRSSPFRKDLAVTSPRALPWPNLDKGVLCPTPTPPQPTTHYHRHQARLPTPPTHLRTTPCTPNPPSGHTQPCRSRAKIGTTPARLGSTHRSTWCVASRADADAHVALPPRVGCKRVEREEEEEEVVVVTPHVRSWRAALCVMPAHIRALAGTLAQLERIGKI